MNPRIIAISGPLQGKVFELDESNLIIGRGASCGVRLDDPSVSTRHCGMCWGGKQALIWDLGSKTGIFVNGFSFPSQILVAGDRIRVGRSIFVYVEADDEEVDPAVLSLTSDEEQWDPTEDGLERTGAYEAAKATVLEQFLNITASITGILDTDQIQSRILELLFKVIPVERAAILLVGHDRDRVVSTMYRSIQNTDAFPLDQALIDQALRQDTEVYRDKIVCYPLATSGTKVGLIYAAMPLAAAQFFTAGHQKLFASIAGLSAITLEHARYVTWLLGENQRLQEEIDVEHGMIGRSEKMQEVYRLLSKTGPLDLTVLITGESGTGKEMVGQALHRNSPRSKMPFHAVNCSAFTETLLGSELFGHEKGAFTGAEVQRKGLFESADGGTIFLDEIGECSMKMQADLLRVIELGEFKRLGGREKETIHVNVRLIAATHVDLEKAIKEGRFRRDLFFRLNVIRIHMPRLSDRHEDIPSLAAFFIKKYGHLRRGASRVQGITPEAHSLLASYQWPGNVRELDHAIQRAIALGTSPYITTDDLPREIVARDGEPDQVGRWNQELNLSKKRILERALQETGGNRQKAAQLLGLHPTYFAALCKELNVKSP
jgi:DNA-binding NtrC family response regulator